MGILVTVSAMEMYDKRVGVVEEEGIAKEKSLYRVFHSSHLNMDNNTAIFNAQTFTIFRIST